MSQRQIAEMLGYQQSSMSSWENGKQLPEPIIVFALEKALTLPPGFLSQHLGYLPLDQDEAPTNVLDAIRKDPGLAEDGKEALIRCYLALLG